MANTKIPDLTLSDTLNTQRLKFNQLLDSVGDVSALTTTAGPVANAINELDAELGTISAGAMGTTASTVSGAIAELDGRLDSINNTQLTSPEIRITGSSVSSVAGKLEVGDSADFASNMSVQGNLAVGGNTTMSGTLTVDGQVTFKAGSDNNIALGDAATDTITLTGEVNSNVIPDADNTYDLGSSSKEWRHVYVDGTVNADNVAADSATITGDLDVQGITTLDSTAIAGNLILSTDKFTVDYTGNTSIAGTLNVDGVTTIDSINAVGLVAITGDLTVSDSARVDGNMSIGGGLNIAGDTTFANTITVQDSAYITGNLDIGGALSAGTTTLGSTTLSSAKVSDLTNDRLVVVGTAGELEDDGNLTWNGTLLDVTGALSVSQGFTVGGTFTTTGVTRNAASYVIVNDQVAVANGNRAGLAVDRPSTDSAVIQWNELGDYWEAGTTAGVKRLALQNDSAAFENVYVAGDLSVSGTTTTINSTAVEIGDRIIELNSGLADNAAPTQDAGIEVERGNRNNAQLVWDESENYWAVHNDSAATKTGTLSRIATSSWLDATAPISYNSSTGNFSHDNAARTNIATSEAVAHSGSFDVVDSIQSNATGHVTQVATRTITLPAGAVPNNATITIGTGDDLETGGNFTTDQSGDETITIDHSDITRTNVSTSQSPGYGGSFDVVDSIQSNARGHITNVATRTITLPASDNTDTVYSLPLATDTVRGGIELFSNTDQSVAANTVTTTAGRTYGVQLNSDNQAVVNVPWVDTNTNTTYTAGRDLDLDGTQFNLETELTGVLDIKNVELISSDGGSYGLLIQGAGSGSGRAPADTLQLYSSEAMELLCASTSDYSYNFRAATQNTGTRAVNINLINTDTSPLPTAKAGYINFQAENSANDYHTYARIYGGQGGNTTDTTEDGDINLEAMYNGSFTNVFNFDGGSGTTTIDGPNYTSIQASNSVLLEPGDGKVILQSTAQEGYLDFATTATIKLYTGTLNGQINSTWTGSDLTVTGDITSVSDVRTKENIETVANGLDLVSQLRGVWYNKIGEDKRKVGVIAQEVEEVLPEVVLTDVEGMKAVDYGKMVGVLIEAIKDLKAEIEELKSTK